MPYELRETIVVTTRRFKDLKTAQAYWEKAEEGSQEGYFAPGGGPVEIVDTETGEPAKDAGGMFHMTAS